MEKKNVVFLTVLAIATLLTAVVGTTFAYFTANINNSANTATTIRSASIAVSYSDGATVNFSEIVPGWAYVKTVSVANNSSAPVVYSINWVDVTNDSKFTDLTYTVYKNAENAGTQTATANFIQASDQTTTEVVDGVTRVSVTSTGTTNITYSTKYDALALPTASNTALCAGATSATLAAGKTDTFYIAFTFANNAEEQDDNQGASFVGTLNAKVDSVSFGDTNINNG